MPTTGFTAGPGPSTIITDSSKIIVGDLAQSYPYVYLDASRIVLTEKTILWPEWTASIEENLHDGSRGLKSYGPKVVMERSGSTAAEAYSKLVKAIEEQGWTVK